MRSKWIAFGLLGAIIVLGVGVVAWGRRSSNVQQPTKPTQVAAAAITCKPTPAAQPKIIGGTSNFNLCVDKNAAVDHPQTYILATGTMVQFNITAAAGVPEETLAIEGYPDVRGEIDGGDGGERTAVRFKADHPGTYRILNATRNTNLGFLTVK